MIKNNRYIYGTLKECVNELWTRIDWENKEFPDFDYAADVPDDLDEDCWLNGHASAWFGCKDVSTLYNADTFTLVFACYGGGGVESMELREGDSDDQKEMFMSRIGNSTDLTGYGILDPNDYTLFEILNAD